MTEFYLGPRETFDIKITKPGNLNRGILDFGTFSSSQGVRFTGYLAAVKSQFQLTPEIVLDSGTLSLPDGRNFTGEFSITYPEGSIL